MKSLPFLLVVCLAIAVSASAHADCRLAFFVEFPKIERDVKALAVADFDHDDKSDLAGSSAAGVFVAFAGGAAVDVDTGNAAGGVLAADFNADGHPDLVFAGGTSIVTRFGNGDGTFAAAVTTAIGITPRAIAIARIDGDAFRDLVALDPVQSVIDVFRGNADGTFTEVSFKTVAANARSLVAADFDADGWTDLVVSFQTGATYSAFYGRGNGTFEAAVAIAGADKTVSIDAAEMTGDGRLDLIAASRDYRVLIQQNLGGRAFSAPSGYYQVFGNDPFDVAAADLTGDGLLDMMSAMTCGFNTWVGSGTGSVAHSRQHDADACRAIASGERDGVIVTGDLDGDDRIDVVVASTGVTRPEVSRFRNVCGESELVLSTDTPLVSAGRDTTIEVAVRAPRDLQIGVPATGTVHVFEGDQPKGTATLATSKARVVVGNLTAGDHTFTATYDGDSQYEPQQSNPVTVHAVNRTTTTTMTVDPPSASGDVKPKLTATVTSDDGTTPTGVIRFFVDGIRAADGAAPTAAYQTFGGIGTHIYAAEYLGDATHPASSATITYLIDREVPKLLVGHTFAIAGAPQDALIELHRSNGELKYASGTVTAMEGGTTLATKTYTPWFNVLLPLPAFTAGRHDIRFLHSGDSFFKPVDTIVPFTVFPASGASIDARGTPDHVYVSWSPSPAIIARRRFDHAWGHATLCCRYAPVLDTDVLPETVYLYRWESLDRTTVGSADVGMQISFTDDPLMPGTTIKSVHLGEIIRATNILRTAASLPLVALDQGGIGTAVTAASVNLLRNAINEARVALGAYAFAFTGTIAPGTIIAASHFRELREAVR